MEIIRIGHSTEVAVKPIVPVLVTLGAKEKPAESPLWRADPEAWTLVKSD